MQFRGGVGGEKRQRGLDAGCGGAARKEKVRETERGSGRVGVCDNTEKESKARWKSTKEEEAGGGGGTTRQVGL